MVKLLDMHKGFLLAHLKEGDTAVDFTMGNGNDTAFLAENVGKLGHVYAFDIQEGALTSTENRLKELGLFERCTLICDSHHNVKKYVAEKIKAGVFNLGYLPRGGHKEITTIRETTMPAVTAALDLLASDGILLVAVYPGHEEGRLEGEMLDEYFSTLSRFAYSVGKFRIINSSESPYFFVVEKK